MGLRTKLQLWRCNRPVYLEIGSLGPAVGYGTGSRRRGPVILGERRVVRLSVLKLAVIIGLTGAARFVYVDGDPGSVVPVMLRDWIHGVRRRAGLRGVDGAGLLLLCWGWGR